jgi:hypothetical protein
MSTPSIHEFWQWWTSTRPRFEQALGTRDWGSLPDEITEQARRLHPSLAWEFAPGVQAEHAFCLCAEEHKAARRFAELCIRAAPPADRAWEFYPARQPRPALHLRIHDHDLDPAEASARLELDPAREKLHVELFHAAFAHVDEDTRGQMAYLLLDGALGEDGMTRWIAAVEAVSEPLEGARPFAELPTHVQTLAGRATGNRYVEVERANRDGMVIPGYVNAALKWIDHLDFDAHVAIAVPLLDIAEAEAEATTIEDALRRMLAGSAAHVGHEIMHGQLLVHFFSVIGGAAAHAIDGYVARNPQRGIRVRWEPDAEWAMLERWA